MKYLVYIPCFLSLSIPAQGSTLDLEEKHLNGTSLPHNFQNHELIQDEIGRCQTMIEAYRQIQLDVSQYQKHKADLEALQETAKSNLLLDISEEISKINRQYNPILKNNFY